MRRDDLGGRRTLAALAHPIRVSILTYLRTHEAASPAEIAQELALPLGTVSYHVRRLDALGLIELVKRRPRRGAIQHYYALAREAASDDIVRHVTGLLARHPDASHAGARVILDATAVGELRDDLRRLFAHMRELEAETVRRTGVKGQAPVFAVDVSCVMDVEGGAP